MHVRVACKAAAGSGAYLFEPASVAAAQAVEVKMRFARRCAPVMTLALALGAMMAPSSLQSAAPPCAETLTRQAGAAALKPSDVLLAITAPRAGETVVEAPPTDSITVTVDYWGPRLVPAEGARAVDEYHLAYFLDEDATPYIGTLMPMPNCNAHIIHTALTRVDFDNVPRGSHSLAVLLVGSNNVSVNPPVAVRVTFMTK